MFIEEKHKNIKVRLTGPRAGWAPTSADRDSKTSFLQIDLGAVYSICAVATQGVNGYGFNEWTKSYKLQLSLNGRTWTYYKADVTDKVRFVLYLHNLFLLGGISKPRNNETKHRNETPKHLKKRNNRKSEHLKKNFFLINEAKITKRPCIYRT